MNEKEIRQMIQEALQEYDTESYEEAGILTSDEGIVLTIDGEEFQITIVKSKGKEE